MDPTQRARENRFDLCDRVRQVGFLCIGGEQTIELDGDLACSVGNRSAHERPCGGPSACNDAARATQARRLSPIID